MVNIWTTDPKKNGPLLVRIGPFLTIFFRASRTPHFGALLGGSGGVKKWKKNEVKMKKKVISGDQKKSVEALNRKKLYGGPQLFIVLNRIYKIL